MYTNWSLKLQPFFFFCFCKWHKYTKLFDWGEFTPNVADFFIPSTYKTQFRFILILIRIPILDLNIGKIIMSSFISDEANQCEPIDDTPN